MLLGGLFKGSTGRRVSSSIGTSQCGVCMYGCSKITIVSDNMTMRYAKEKVRWSIR